MSPTPGFEAADVCSRDPVELRVAAAFQNDAARGYATEYLSHVHESWREVASRMRGAVISCAITVTIFNLLVQTKVSELSVGPVKLSSTTTVSVIIPIVAAYFLYELLLLIRLDNLFHHLHFQLVNVMYPTLVEQELNYALHPVTPWLFGEHDWLMRLPPSRAHTLWKGTGLVTMVLLPVVLAGTLVAGYVQLLDRNGSALVWVSLGASLLLLVRAMLLFTTLGDDAAAQVDP